MTKEEQHWLEQGGKCPYCGSAMRLSDRESSLMRIYDCTACDGHRGFRDDDWFREVSE